MLRRIVVSAVAGLALTVTAAAFAGPTGKPVEDDFSESFVDPDFCGTGAEVAISIEANQKVWIGETGGDPEQVLKAVFNIEIRFTFGSTTLVERSAGQTLNTIIVGLESGAHTHEFVEKGLRGRLKLEHGGVLIRDAGVLVYRVSFDASGEFVSLELVDVRGPHPVFESDGEAWCEAATEALGITS